ncbi:hypothetical protein IGI04_012646 [Brassica rapa subsp. trilocularis]|uniref:Uncharacterized protein n=1 Tax=Brassica rapa subsp. trilocularis TaxID=1813537 RepID=A0ABQ7N6H9_BRACM|nr:hypothetical protein IGI04_012646 [Brassica rapa subsp. trilocularis]
MPKTRMCLKLLTDMRDTIGLHVKLLLYWVTFFRFFFKLVQELYCLQMRFQRYSYQPPSMSMLTDLTPIGLALEGKDTQSPLGNTYSLVLKQLQFGQRYRRQRQPARAWSLARRADLCFKKHDKAWPIIKVRSKSRAT